MSDKDKSKSQLVAEVTALRQRVAQLESLVTEPGQTNTRQESVDNDLRHAETKYRALIEQLPAITYILEGGKDQEKKTTYISPQVEALLGFSPAEWLADSKFWINQISPEDKDHIEKKIKLNEAHSEPLNLEYRILGRDGRVLWVRELQITIPASADQPDYTLGVMFDITQHKILEAQFQHAQRMEAVAQMAGGVAHNFNNVLTALIGNTELALMQLSADHPAYSNLEIVRKSAERAAKLTQKLLTFTRHQTVRPMILNLNNLIYNTETVLHQIVGNSIKLIIVSSSNLAPVRVDAAQIEQVLLNLVINARDAMPDGGKLTLETANINLDASYIRQTQADLFPGKYVMLAVSDTGIGMTQEVKAQIFEPFFTTKDATKGTGLGLSACFGIVKQNGGHITVDSEPNQGTTVKVYLPCFQDPSSPVNAVVETEAAGQPANPQTILLVEDEPLVREFAVKVLSQQGYTVLEANRAETALEMTQPQANVNIDLLITDFALPGMRGDILAQELLALYPTLKVLFTSGYTSEAIAQVGALDENIELLSKPFSPANLIQKVHDIINSP